MAKQLFLIGSGPGDPAQLTLAARAALDACTDWVGYQLYLDLLAPLDAAASKQKHSLALGEEMPRARLALDLAAAGRTTALISSGDIGIYGMAAAVFEWLDHKPQPEWQAIDLQLLPGISAMQTACARAGAMLGHDFCTISLSDLLTPWEAIEKRLHAAGSADFVVCLYNPKSRRRSWQLDAAQRILLDHRAGSTPVVIARSLGRADESTCQTTLSGLPVEQVDMLSLVIIGNRQSRCFEQNGRRWAYTPRGYGTQP